jgi:HD-like signal output (HDOD) protein
MPTAVASDVIQVPAELRLHLQRKSGGVNMLPAVAMQALELAKDPECSITEFARVVERDVKLATDILSLANSSLYAGSAPLSSLHQSIVRLGLRQCKNLIYCSSVTALMNKMTAEDAAARERMWKHSFHTALLALHFNHSLNLGYQGEEFTAGLMHDFGRTLLAVCLPDRSAELDRLDFDSSPMLLERELMLTGTTHCELGAWFAAENRLPEPLIDAVRYHHQPAWSRKHLKLVALTAVCDHMANHIFTQGKADGYDPAENEALGQLELGGVRDAVQRFTAVHAVLMRAAHYDAEQMMKS